MTNIETIRFRQSVINKYKITMGCSVCGYNKHPSALCFDHLPEFDKHPSCKSGSKAGGMFMLYNKKYSSKTIVSEIQKCRILCANCHMENTHSKSYISDQNVQNIDNLRTILDSQK